MANGRPGAALAIGGGRSAAPAISRSSAPGQFAPVLAAARTGAEWAWSTLYKQFAPSVLGYLRAQGAPEPEDLTAEAFYQVVKGLGRFEGGEQDFRSWVLVIAHRKLIDDHRYRGRRPVQPMTEQLIESRGPLGNVEDEALIQMDDMRFESLMASLTRDQRDVLLLRMLGGLGIAEVAAAMGRRPAAVQALQHRALAKLKKLLS